MRVIDNLNFEKYKENPKWIIGYSDITAIHNDLHNNKSESIHGIMCKSLEKIDVDNNESISLLKKTLFGEKLSYTIEGNNYNIEGNSNGQLIGGNLTLLHCLLGSESSIDTDGKILFIEDLGEYLYHIDRMLISLKRAGYFDNCKGLIVGDFTDMRKNTTPFGRNLKELILDIVKEYDFPVSFGFPAGHGEKNYPMILGREIDFEVSKQQSTINFSN
jgi:muramoyltetrapeptide carboxypeptidase